MQVHYGCIPPLIHNEISKALCKGFLQYFFLMYYTYVVIVFLGTYSRVPNKRTGRLLENQKNSHLYPLIWDYSFINFEQKFPPLRLFPPIPFYIFELFHCLIFTM